MKYQLVEKMTMAHVNKASELLGKVDLKQFSFLVGVAMEGHADIEAQIFKNGLFADSITEFLKTVSKENLLCDFAAILLEDPKAEKPTTYEEWEEQHEVITNALVFEDPKEVFSLVGKFLQEKFDLKTSLKNFMSKAMEVEELPQT